MEYESATSRGSAGGVQLGLGILKSIHDEIAGGWLVSMKGLISAEIFSDFLEMAEYLLQQGYKDPAAVVAGSVLEEHLRQLCGRNAIDIVVLNNTGKRHSKKADTLNADLAKKQVYNLLDQKAVTMWLDLRNNAAHGGYDEYTTEQVEQMIRGITEFMARVGI